jgi:hypothetical protein
MTALPGYPVFKAKDDFDIFIERLQNAFNVNKTEENDKVAILLNQIDVEVYKILRNLCSPDSPSTKTFDDIFTLLKRQYVRETSAWKERKKFFNAVQKRMESVNDWYLRLKTLASNCDFGTDLPAMLKNKFVCGLDSAPIFERLAEENCSISMEDILKIAITKEAVLPKPTEKENQPKPQKEANAAAKPKPEKKKSQNEPPKMEQKSEQQPQNSRPRTCRHCGEMNHDFSNCKHKTTVCNGCQQVGHVLKVCRRKNQKNQPAVNSISINLIDSSRK